MPIFDQFERASFSAIEFPVKSVRVRGALRHHMHKWRHVPGGEPEKLGREPYQIDMQCAFHATVRGYGGLSFHNGAPRQSRPAPQS